MDGAIIISTDGGRIARANVHLVPDPTVPTSRDRHPSPHRRARRPVARRAGGSAPARRWASSTCTRAARKHQLQEIGRLLDRANQALQTLERYKARLDDAIANLTARRGRRRRHAARRRPRRAARRDGAPHRRRDRDDDHRARRRRPAAAPPARRALRRDRRRARPRRRRLPADRSRRAARRSRRCHGSPTTRCSTCESPPPRCTARATPVISNRSWRRRDCGCCTASHRLPHGPAAAITDHFGGLAKLQRVTVDDLMAVEGVDVATAQLGEGDPRPGHREHDPRPVQLVPRQAPLASLPC